MSQDTRSPLPTDAPPREPARQLAGFRPRLLLHEDHDLCPGCGEPLALTAREFDLLLYFARRPGRVFSRSDLLDRVWGYGHDGYEHTVNSHINRLRAKLERNPRRPDYIKTVWGVGYKLADPPVRDVPIAAAGASA